MTRSASRRNAVLAAGSTAIAGALLLVAVGGVAAAATSSTPGSWNDSSHSPTNASSSGPAGLLSSVPSTTAASSSLADSPAARPSTTATAPVVQDPAATETPSASASPTVSPTQSYTVRVSAAPLWHALHTYQVTGVIAPMPPKGTTVVLQAVVGPRWINRVVPTLKADGTFSGNWTVVAPAKTAIRAVVSVPGVFRFSSPTLVVTTVAALDPVVTTISRGTVHYSWRSGCPVPVSSLRSITMTYWNFHGQLQRGTLIGASWAVSTYEYVFNQALAHNFPIAKIIPTEYFYGNGRRNSAQSDLAAMAADNTSAFNCRKVTGNPYRVSQHSYGDAIDINTLENPYLTGGRVFPAAGKAFVKRTPYRMGMIQTQSWVARAMTARGWLWGARWSNPDYQHFSRDGA